MGISTCKERVSRGCTNRCQFCAEWNLFGRRFRVRSIENVLNDIETIFRAHRGDREGLLHLLLPEPDMVHLSEEGHEVYFSAVYPMLEKAVLELI